MKKTISTYWPIAMLVPLALAGLCHVRHPAANTMDTHAHSAANVSAEFARALSFGLVDTDASEPAFGAAAAHRAVSASQSL
jgi:hypothetical protein